MASVEAGNTLDAAAVENGLSAYAGTYGEGTRAYYDADLIAALDETAEGSATAIVETDSELYLGVVTKELDEDATASRKETLVETKKTEHFNGVLTAWLEEYPITVDETVWEQIVFDRSYETKAN